MEMTPKRIVIHCTATPNGKDISLEALERAHRLRGFTTIGYHHVIQPKGEIIQTRANEIEGAHVKGENHDTIGIALVWEDKFTSDQWKSLRFIVRDLLEVYKIPSYEIYGHYEFASAREQGKTCPNVPIKRLFSWILDGSNQALEEHLL